MRSGRFPEADGNTCGVGRESQNMETGVCFAFGEIASPDDLIQHLQSIRAAVGVIFGWFTEQIRQRGFQIVGFFRPEHSGGIANLDALA